VPFFAPEEDPPLDDPLLEEVNVDGPPLLPAAKGGEPPGVQSPRLVFCGESAHETSNDAKSANGALATAAATIPTGCPNGCGFTAAAVSHSLALREVGSSARNHASSGIPMQPSLVRCDADGARRVVSTPLPAGPKAPISQGMPLLLEG
jgi:hypothetical protein